MKFDTYEIRDNIDRDNIICSLQNKPQCIHENEKVQISIDYCFREEKIRVGRLE